MFKKIHKAWVSLRGTAIETLIDPRSIVFGKERENLEMIFMSESPESTAISSGKDFAYNKNIETFVTLEAKPKSEHGYAQDQSKIRGYKITEQIPAETKAIAWYEIGEGMEAEAIPLEIVAEDAVKNSQQIFLGAGGRVKVSSDLIEKDIKIRIPVIFSTQVILLNKPLHEFVCHLIGETDTNLFVYAEYLCHYPEKLKSINRRTIRVNTRMLREEVVAT